MTHRVRSSQAAKVETSDEDAGSLRLVHGECIDWLKRTPENVVDLVFGSSHNEHTTSAPEPAKTATHQLPQPRRPGITFSTLLLCFRSRGPLETP